MISKQSYIRRLCSFFRHSHSRKGFTLIELLVVFTIAALLTGIGIASFVSYSRTQQVNQTTNDLKLLINEAKFNSLSVVKTATNSDGTVVTCGSERLNGYSITIIGNSEIQLSQICEIAGSREIKRISLPSNITITSANQGANCTVILFGSLSSVASGVPCSIEVTGYNQSKTIDIDAVGNTSIELDE